jgi:Family of unknown function (DUF6152)
MNSKRLRAILVAGFSIATVGSAFGHHGSAAYMDKSLTLKGTVTEWKWLNPHSFLKFDVKDENGEVVHWTGEWNAPAALVNFGITAKSFKQGDHVTVIIRRVAKSGALVGRVDSVITADGQKLTMLYQ